MKLTIEHIIQSAQSEMLVPPRDADATLTTLVWDSRLVVEGSLFVAIVGGHVNGNDYIIQALEAGAGAVIASQVPTAAIRDAARQSGAALFLAADNDAVEALLALARIWRENFKGIVVGVTGSSGKTTTKDLIAAVAGQTFATYATRGNRNSELGLAETLLDATAEHALIVCEMGMQGLGEIARLAEVARPHLGVVTNIGVAHCELLGSRVNIARAKAELLESLPSNTGIAVVPGDDPFTPQLCEFACLEERKVSVVTYGLGELNDIRATNITYDAMGYPSFDVWTPDGCCYPICLSLQGEHNVLNALAAVAVGLRTGVSIEAITQALAAIKPAALRQEILKTAEGDIILNDTYNANPDSMRAALSLLRRLATANKRIAVLGDMYELGAEEEHYHRQIGEYAFVNGVDELVTVGKLAREIAAGALEVGMPPERVHCCTEVGEVLETLDRILSETRGTAEAESIILVKASRGMQLERVVEGLTAAVASKDPE